MAATTIADILTRFQTVLESTTVELLPSRDAFSHDRQPNTMLNNTYWIQDEGMTRSQALTSYAVARIDRLTVYLARKLSFAPVTELDTLHDSLVLIERAIKSDGPNNDYHADVVQRRVTRPEGRDLAVGSVTFDVDYDFDETLVTA